MSDKGTERKKGYMKNYYNQRKKIVKSFNCVEELEKVSVNK